MLSTSGEVPSPAVTKLGSAVAAKGPQLRGLMSSICSYSEEIWSRGSLYEKELLDCSSLTSPPLPAPKPASLYQYDFGGIVVFDSKAHIHGDGFPVHAVKVQGDMRRKVGEVLASDPDKKKYFTMKQYSPFPTFVSEYELTVPPDALKFESRFESGNLRRAIRRLEKEYYLLIQEDTESRGHTQWFYFAVKNKKPGTYKFQVINLYKEDSLYSEGMLPVVLSTKQGKGWLSAGRDVSYVENAFPLPSKPMEKSYTLSFTYDFVYEDDTVFFAHSVPYTYTELSSYLRELNSKYPSLVRVDPMCQTLSGNVCEVVTITDNIATYRSFHSEVMEWGLSAAGRKAHRNKLVWDGETHKKKKAIVLTARVHPGETPGSFILRGAIDFLTSSNPIAHFLLSNFVFKIIPMLNPDGVRYGNYRCSLLGVDLNRRWRNPSRTMHPTIYFAKRLIQTFGEQHEIVLFCDMHGHSCKRNAFLYGCSQAGVSAAERKKNIIGKVVPLLLCEKNKGVAWNQCYFRLDRCKEATARVVAYSELGVTNSYTLEASFFGPDDAIFDRSSPQFLTSDYEQIGRNLLEVAVCFATQESLFQAVKRIPELLEQKQVCQTPLFSSENANNTNETRSVDLLAEQSEDSIWEVLFDLDEKLNIERQSIHESDSSCSEESEEEIIKPRKSPIKVGKVNQKCRFRSSEMRALPPKVILKEPQLIGNTRKVGFMDGSPKLFRSHRAVSSKSPQGPASNRGKSGFKVSGEGFRGIRKEEATDSTSPSHSSHFPEPFFLPTEPSLRPQPSLSKLLPSGPVRCSSMKRYHLNDSLRPTTVMEYIRKAIKCGKMKPMRVEEFGEDARRDIVRRSLQVQSRGLARLGNKRDVGRV